MRGYQGFTLIEILVSLALIGLVMLVASILISTNELSRNARSTALAQEIVESALERARAEGASSLSNSALVDERFSKLPGGSGTIRTSPYDAGLDEVTVEVSWQNSEENSKSISLTTLIAHENGL